MINWLKSKLGIKAETTPGPLDDFWYLPVAGGAGSFAGVRVTADTAKRIGTVMSCVTVLRETTASSPCIVYEKRRDDTRERATSHEMYKILHDAPNPWQTSFQFWEMAVTHLCLRGTFYAEKIYGPDGRLLAVVPRHPDYVTPYLMDDRSVYFDVRNPKGGASRIVRQSEMFWVLYASEDGVTPLTPIQAIAESIGLTVAAQAYGGRVFSSGGSQRVAVTHPAQLTPDAKARFREAWEQVYGGNNNQHKVAILDEGMTASVIGVSARDAQLLEVMKFTAADIIGIFRVPPHLIGQVEKQTSWGTGIEQMNLGFLTLTMTPWFERLEQVIQRDILDGEDGYYAEFLVDGLLRGDSAARSEFYSKGILNGWMSRNEARVRENLPPVQGCDKLLVPVNMTVLGDDGRIEQQAAEEQVQQQDAEAAIDEVDDDDDSAEQMDASAWLPLIEDAAERIASREAHNIDRRVENAASDKAKWGEWLAKFYDGHASHVAKAVAPLAIAFNSATGMDVQFDGIVETLTASRCNLLSQAADPAAEWSMMRETAKADITNLIARTMQCDTATSSQQ